MLDIFAYGESENMRPLPFKARFIPRSKEQESLILNEAAKARDFLQQYDGESAVKMEPLEV